MEFRQLKPLLSQLRELKCKHTEWPACRHTTEPRQPHHGATAATQPGHGSREQGGPATAPPAAAPDCHTLPWITVHITCLYLQPQK